MPRKNDKPAGPFAVNTLTITAITLIGLMVGAYVIYSLVVRGNGTGEAPLPLPRPPAASETADLGAFDYSSAVTSLDGTETSMSAFKGKVIFLNFWASWCPPCIVELPSIQRLHDGMKEAGDIAFLMVSTEEARNIRAFLDQRRYDFPVYIGDNRLLNAFRVSAYPATFVLDRRGRIVFKHMGAAKWDDKAFMAYLDQLARNP
ncbi:TlpA family protein disulfide reductase [Desulfococcus sp.]|uniref:TlpA family protein disulfide reductase n=1 Tax=Desulfococcus sp. TaxID=2025834 RepID=UPI0035934E5B